MKDRGGYNDKLWGVFYTSPPEFVLMSIAGKNTNFFSLTAKFIIFIYDNSENDVHLSSIHLFEIRDSVGESS